MLYKPDIPTEARELTEAWASWKQLQANANTFLALPQVQQALVDEEYRLTEFREPWPTNGPVGVDRSEGRHREPSRSYFGRASFLRKAANHTQKALVRDGSTEGLKEMTVIQEWMNILVDGRTLHSTYETGELFVPERVQQIEGLTIHAVATVMKHLHVTRGPLESEMMPHAVREADAYKRLIAEGPTPNTGDRWVGETHGLHVIASHENAAVQDGILDVNPMGTHEQIRDGFSYGNIEEGEMYNRLQGAWFRWLQIREYAKKQMTGLAEKAGWTLPEGTVSTTIASEVCTAKALEHEGPTFFQGQWGIGPVAQRIQTIDFTRGDIQRQLQFALPMIAKTILHYPTDQPLMKV